MVSLASHEEQNQGETASLALSKGWNPFIVIFCILFFVQIKHIKWSLVSFRGTAWRIV